MQFQGAREYAVRIWLDPDKAAAHDINASEVLSALRAQNLQVSAGILNQPPTPGDEAYQINVETLGRLTTPDQFADIIVKSDSRGRVTRVRHRTGGGWRRRLRQHDLHGPQQCLDAARLCGARRQLARGRT